jgi:hypothetical protein
VNPICFGGLSENVGFVRSCYPLYIEEKAARVNAKGGTMHGNDSANATLDTDTRLGAGEKGLQRLGLGPLA